MIAAFQEALAALLSLPKEERDRALVIARLINDGERVEFMRHLTDLNGQITTMEKEQEEILSGAETIVVSAERKFHSLERDEAEGQARDTDMRAAEQNLFRSTSC